MLLKSQKNKESKPMTISSMTENRPMNSQRLDAAEKRDEEIIDATRFQKSFSGDKKRKKDINQMARDS